MTTAAMRSPSLNQPAGLCWHEVLAQRDYLVRFARRKLHDPALAHRFCDRALLLYGDGRTESAAVDDILTAKTLSELYGYGLRQLEDRGHRCFIPE